MAALKKIDTSLQQVLTLLSTLLSVLSFFLLRLFHLLQAYPIFFTSLCFLSFVILLFLPKPEKEKNAGIIRKNIIVYVLVFIALSILSSCFSFSDTRKYSDSELVSDATEGLLSAMKLDNRDQDKEWIKSAIRDNMGTVLLIPSGYSREEFIKDVYDESKFFADSTCQPGDALRCLWIDVLYGDKVVNADYTLTFIFTPHLKDGYHIEGAKVMPESINYVLNGELEMINEEWVSAKRNFEQADSLGNYMGTYNLSRWYATGYGCKPNDAQGKEFLKKAADGGCRIARLQLGSDIINDMSHTLLQLSFAEEYLQKASILSTVVVSTLIDDAEQSLKVLDAYYNATGQGRKAYKATRKCYQAYANDKVKYNAHLENCLKIGKFKEALQIISKGEAEGHPKCYTAHATMLMSGYGLKKDYDGAEKLLRYATDSLDYYPAYKTLARLYRIQGMKDSGDFYEMLYNVKFSKH